MEISDDFIKKLFNSMPRRLEAVIAAKGGNGKQRRKSDE